MLLRKKCVLTVGSFLLVPLVFSVSHAGAQTLTPTLTVEQEKQNLRMEKLELENRELKLKVEELEFQATKTARPLEVPTATPGLEKSGEGQKDKEGQTFKADFSKQAEKLARLRKDEKNLLVVDFVNAEIWNQGVRYNLHELDGMADECHWKMTVQVDEIAPNGDRRQLYRACNISLLRYEGRLRGILTFIAPLNESDFQVITPDGLSFDSVIGDVRDAAPNEYFVFDGERKEDGGKTLKYLHPVSLDFSDRLEFNFDKSGKLVKIRYGVLDEH